MLKCSSGAGKDPSHPIWRARLWTDFRNPFASFEEPILPDWPPITSLGHSLFKEKAPEAGWMDSKSL
jgi:hypothetical protein